MMGRQLNAQFIIFDKNPMIDYAKSMPILETCLGLDIPRRINDNSVIQNTERDNNLTTVDNRVFMRFQQKLIEKLAKLLGIELPKFSAELGFFQFNIFSKSTHFRSILSSIFIRWFQAVRHT